MRKPKWSICHICNGDGSVVNPNIDDRGLTREDFQEDPDFAEDYHAGIYNISCQTCSGSGKLLTAELKDINRRLREAAADRRLRAMEDGDYDSYCGASDYRHGY